MKAASFAKEVIFLDVLIMIIFAQIIFTEVGVLQKGNSPEIRKRKLIKYIDTFLHFSFSIHNFVHLDEVAIDVTWHIVQLSLTAFALCTSFREVQELVKMAIIDSTIPYRGQNNVRDGGSTALYAAYTVDTFDTFDTFDTVNTVDMDMHFQFSRSE